MQTAAAEYCETQHNEQAAFDVNLLSELRQWAEKYYKEQEEYCCLELVDIEG